MAEKGQIFYIYDTIHKMNTLYYKEHRNLVANIAKRSRYFMVNPGKIDEPLETHGQREIGSRFFEGLAAGEALRSYLHLAPKRGPEANVVPRRAPSLVRAPVLCGEDSFFEFAGVIPEV